MQISFALIQILIKRLLQNFARAMTAVLSWPVQNLVVIRWPGMELQLNEMPIKFEL